ncbi:MAG: PBP1A family penicillin-binding protein [Candidatus Desulfovibrio faecigallinarum]|nr:PBP1A family penicillin-binding protein [Candidatus Desulfovibrio faecigallinarum]OUO55439.1 penicillin-binding protein [Desulfovibrio sp. An276]
MLGLGAIGCAAGFFLYNWVSQDLPDLDRILDFKAAQATTILARDGSVLGTLSHEKRYVITLDDMPKYLPMAFLAIEDSAFYQHPGINPLAILRAMLVNFERGTKSQGGSTITQQIVKQLLLSSERSYVRKMKEAILATRLERELSKDQILSLYLNYIFLGQQSYGVEAAARTYFGKHAANITLAEACVIAGMPQAPSRYNPFRNPEAAKARQMEVLNRLRVLEWISEEDYQKAANEPLVYWSMPDKTIGASQWYFEEARRLLIEFFTESNLKALGVETNRFGLDYVYEAGLTVQTAMDPLQQQLAGQALRSGLETIDKRQGWRGAIRQLVSKAEQQAFLDKKNFEPGELADNEWTQALVTSVSPREIHVDLGSGYTGVIRQNNFKWANKRSKLAPKARRQGIVSPGDVVWVSLAPRREAAPKKGSKKTVPAESLDNTPVKGVAVELLLQQEPLVQGAIVSIEPQSGDVVALIGGYQFGESHFNRATQSRRQPGSSFKPIVYSTALDNGFTPTSSVLDAPIEYVNPATGQIWRPSNFENSYKGEMPLWQALALSRNTPTVRLAQAVGIDKVIERAKMLGLEPDFPQVLSVSLGAVGVSPLNLTQAYTAFANGGIASRPRIITSIKDSRGRELYRQEVEQWQAVSPQNAFQVTTLLRRVVENGTGRRAFIDGLHISGKTGTSNDTRDCWFMGYTPYLCTGVYVGYDQMDSLGSWEQGGRTAAPIFKAYREKADKAYASAPQDMTMPEGITMIDGLPYLTENTGPGLSAVDGAVPGAEDSGMPMDTGEDSEMLMRQMF